MVLAVHFSVHNFPIVFITLPLIALDALLVILVLLYYRYKANVASKQRAYKMQQRVLVSKGSLAIPGRSIVPCELQNTIPTKTVKANKITSTERQKRDFGYILQRLPGLLMLVLDLLIFAVDL